MADSTSSSMPVGTTGAGGGNMLRITGLNTGLDVDAMVKKMLTADQTKVDNAKKQQQLIQWRQEAYQSIIKDVKDLQSAYFDVTNSSNYLLSSNSYNNMTATSSDATIASAKASATSVAGTYKIKVDQLAQAATISGNQYLVSDVSKWNGGSITFNGSQITLSKTSTSASDLVSDINKQISESSDLNGKVTASLVTYADKDYINFTSTSENTISMSDIGETSTFFNSNTKLSELGINAGTTYSLSLNGSSFDFKATDSSTIQDLADAIKNGTDGKVTARLNELTGQFSIQTSDTGSGSKLSITDSDDILSKLGIDASKTATGVDAKVSIKEPGSSEYIDTTQNSNNFTVNGVTYSLTDVTAENESISISVTQDTSKVHDLITNFIDKYNNLIGEIQDKISEKKDYDYSPLTDTQKSSMSDTDITNWETKAKQGILRNDDNLEQLLNDLTSAFSSPVLDSNNKNVSTLYFGNIGSNSIGIDTSDDVTQGGKLSIVDDAKFTDALTNHADEIMKLFTTTSDSKNSTDKFNQSGIFQRISDIVTNNVGVIGSTYNSGTLTKYANLQDDYSISGGGGTGTLPDQIYQQQLLISTLTDRMNDDQTKYYNQFTQLETAMETLNAQQSTLSMYLS
ncbi:flagellar filament capping protein FliD [Clostridium tyrobutyricum]|uniref:flagellar filament capping protein FliD n=1 Tax=Clostridium tyrobutyricum TaxID=1519 RepID=UPI001C38DE23|nr:flagellar filament capping protein FliD [Clostridium tyrobutyricum]MBV4416559.1 flagellar filament capping protein FliD [Clostridium tyrobutyricum]MBV4421985.1 flagellar filament capping protein FliD [Clostridium tyrobutyricum]